jgi:hypothetical protein
LNLTLELLPSDIFIFSEVLTVVSLLSTLELLAYVGELTGFLASSVFSFAFSEEFDNASFPASSASFLSSEADLAFPSAPLSPFAAALSDSF